MFGSIEKRGKNSWRLEVSGGRGPDGKRIKYRKTINANSKGQAKKELAKMIAEIEKGQFAQASNLSLSDFVERWLRDYAKVNLAPKTLVRYKQILKSRIIPALGHIKIEKIRPNHLMEFYSNLQEDGIREDGKPGGLSNSTILYHHRILSSILQDAVQWQLIVSNPASRVKPLRVKRKQAKCYDEEQTSKLLKALEHEPLKYRLIITLAIATGLRRGELMGLEWQDINFEEETLYVRQTSQYISGIGVITKEPKNDTSHRNVSVPTSVMVLLRRYKNHWMQERLKVGDLWQGSERLFTSWDGRPMHPDTISKWFPRFLKRNGLSSLPFHGLRHTSATLLINRGLHAKTISSRLGHSNISTTMDIYGHTLKKADKEAADKLDKLFDNEIKETGSHYKVAR